MHTLDKIRRFRRVTVTTKPFKIKKIKISTDCSTNCCKLTKKHENHYHCFPTTDCKTDSFLSTYGLYIGLSAGGFLVLLILLIICVKLIMKKKKEKLLEQEERE